MRPLASVVTMSDYRYRSNGFAKPWHPLQVTSWVAFALFFIFFFVFLFPALPQPLNYILAVLYVILVGLVVTSAAIIMRSNPMDPCCPEGGVKHWQNESHDARMERMKNYEEGKNWCSYCYNHVRPRSKHCRVCNKCVDVFDHHCKWLNTCIGGINYRTFIVTIVSTTCMLSFQSSIAIWAIVISFTQPVVFSKRMAVVGVSVPGFQGAVIFLLVLLVPFTLSVAQLLGLHIFLMRKELTTYDWILEHRAKLKEREAELARREFEQSLIKKPKKKGVWQAVKGWASPSPNKKTKDRKTPKSSTKNKKGKKNHKVIPESSELGSTLSEDQMSERLRPDLMDTNGTKRQLMSDNEFTMDKKADFSGTTDQKKDSNHAIASIMTDAEPVTSTLTPYGSVSQTQLGRSDTSESTHVLPGVIDENKTTLPPPNKLSIQNPSPLSQKKKTLPPLSINSSPGKPKLAPLSTQSPTHTTKKKRKSKKKKKKKRKGSNEVVPATPVLIESSDDEKSMEI